MKKSSTHLFLQKQESILTIKILDSHFYRNDKLEWLDSRLLGNDKKITVGDTGFLFFPLLQE